MPMRKTFIKTMHTRVKMKISEKQIMQLMDIASDCLQLDLVRDSSKKIILKLLMAIKNQQSEELKDIE